MSSDCSVTIRTRQDTQVVLVGCFHGSQSSANDVARIVQEKDTNVIALELCASRFADLRQSMQRKKSIQQDQNSLTVTTTPNQDNSETYSERPWVWRWLDMIQTTSQTRGLPSGLAAAVLAGFSGVQVALSGLAPGLEFTTAVETAQGADVVLADQEVDETLDRIGRLPQVSLQLAKDLCTKGWSKSYGPCSSALATALIGRPNAPSVQLGSFLTRNPEAIQEVVRLIIPPFILLQTTVYATNTFVDLVWLSMGNPATTMAPVLLEDTSGWGIGFFSNILLVVVSYLGLVLPVVKVILLERDVYLADGIREACRRAGPNGRVVAVLGLLHVNGVAKLLEEEMELL